MPIVKVNGKLILFAHVPKCAGTSVEEYLSERFGALSLLDRTWWGQGKEKWTNSSPQHIDAATLSKLFAPGFFDAIFSVVRDPADRFASAFSHNKKMGMLPAHWSAKTTLRKIAKADERFHHQFDNHFLQMNQLVPDEAKVFKLEDGFSDMIEWLSAIADHQDNETKLKQINTSEELIDVTQAFPRNLLFGPEFKLDSEVRDLIHSVYASDYERFGY